MESMAQVNGTACLSQLYAATPVKTASAADAAASREMCLCDPFPEAIGCPSTIPMVHTTYQ